MASCHRTVVMVPYNRYPIAWIHLPSFSTPHPTPPLHPFCFFGLLHISMCSLRYLVFSQSTWRWPSNFYCHPFVKFQLCMAPHMFTLYMYVCDVIPFMVCGRLVCTGMYSFDLIVRCTCTPIVVIIWSSQVHMYTHSGHHMV